MPERFLRFVRHWLLVLAAAALALSFFRESALGRAVDGSSWIAVVLLGFVLYELGKPLWRLRSWWLRHKRARRGPELPTPAQWVGPRVRRQRNREGR